MATLSALENSELVSLLSKCASFCPRFSCPVVETEQGSIRPGYRVSVGSPFDPLLFHTRGRIVPPSSQRSPFLPASTSCLDVTGRATCLSNEASNGKRTHRHSCRVLSGVVLFFSSTVERQCLIHKPAVQGPALIDVCLQFSFRCTSG